MVARAETVAYLGLEARTVEVQCQVAPGMPGFHLVGLPALVIVISEDCNDGHPACPQVVA